MLGVKEAFLALCLLFSGIALAFRALYVWTSCGYDCAALPWPNLGVLSAAAVSIVLLVVAGGLLAGLAIGKPR